MTTWLKTLRDAPAKWRRRSRAERLLLLEAVVLLGVARLLLITIPFRWLAGLFRLLLPGKALNITSIQHC